MMQRLPVLLKQAMEKILDHKVKTPMIILNDLNLPSSEIEESCNLETGRLTRPDNIVYLEFKAK